MSKVSSSVQAVLEDVVALGVDTASPLISGAPYIPMPCRLPNHHRSKKTQKQTYATTGRSPVMQCLCLWNCCTTFSFFQCRPSKTTYTASREPMPTSNPLGALLVLIQKGEQVGMQNVHGPRRLPAVDDTRDVDLAGACAVRVRSRLGKKGDGGRGTYLVISSRCSRCARRAWRTSCRRCRPCSSCRRRRG